MFFSHFKIKIKKKLFDLLVFFVEKNIKFFIKVANFLNNLFFNEYESLKNLREYTVSDAIIDIGVEKGTPDLYRAFKDKFFLLIDPIKVDLLSEPENYIFVQEALSYKTLETNLNIHPSGRSSLKDPIKFGSLLHVDNFEKSNIKTSTLDQIIDKYLKDYKYIGIKIDTQGSEGDILDGLEKNINKVSFIILENNIVQRYKDSDLFSKITCKLYNKNFFFLKFLNSGSVIPRYAFDCVYLPKDNPVFYSEDIHKKNTFAK